MMETEYIKPYCTLQQELDQAKNTLITLNDNIRRIVGRDPKETESPNNGSSFSRGDKHTDLKRSDSDRQMGNGGGYKDRDNGHVQPPHKRRNIESKSVFNRLSAPAPRVADDDYRPRLNSRVIRELPSRQEIVAAQGADAESRARNRRMFGSLLGTLHKFCVEESRLKQKEDKKAKIEKKLEEQEILEKQSLRREREMLFLDRKRKQMEIRKLELKMSRLKDFETWEAAQQQLKGHIRTKTKPHLYFRPRHMNKHSEKMLADTRSFLKKQLQEKRDAINKEIAEIEDRFKLQEDENGSGENAPGLDNSDSCIVPAIEPVKPIEISETKDEDMNNGTVSEAAAEPPIEVKIKSESDCKENDASNIIEPKLSSSIVVATVGSPKEKKLLD